MYVYSTHIAIKTMGKLHITKEETVWKITGDTFRWKDKIKALYGAKWWPSDRSWRVPLTTDITAFEEDVVLTEVEDAEEMRRWKAAVAAKPALPAYGQCCAKAKIVEEYWQGPMHYSCTEHGARPITKKGFGYTGD